MYQIIPPLSHEDKVTPLTAACRMICDEKRNGGNVEDPPRSAAAAERHRQPTIFSSVRIQLCMRDNAVDYADQLGRSKSVIAVTMAG